MLASPVLQIARSLDWCFSKRSLGLKRRGSLQEQAFTFVSMCSLLTARYAVVHQTSFSEASSELDHCEVNVTTDQHCDPPNLPKPLAFHSVKWLFSRIPIPS